MRIIKSFSLICGLLALLIQPSLGAPLAGHVILTKGTVSATAEDGQRRALKRRSQIFNGDTIKTGPAGSVQIRFVDKALMTIKASSEMNIEAYLLAQQGNDEQKDQALMSLVKGGFRTITGTIGKGDKSAYKVNTPAASIGIRGTNYEVQQESDGGFVMGVYNGGIEVENEAGTIELGEGADFNFTRVKPKSAPKGLLAPPPALGVNNATEQTDEETEEDSEDSTNGDGKESDPNEEEQDEAEGSGEESDDSGNALDAVTALPDSEGDINNAIDNKLTNTIEETKDEFVESGGAKQALLDALIAAGILSSGQTLDDLDPVFLELVNKWLENPNFDVVAAIQNLINEGIASGFSFENPYLGVDVSKSDNPFDATTITDQQFALAETGKLALLAIPVNSTSNFAGDSPSITTNEAQLVSPNVINNSNFNAFPYSLAGNETRLRLNYDLLNVTTGKTDEYEIEIVFSDDIPDITTLENYIYTALSESDNFRINGVDQSGGGTAPGHVNLMYNASSERYEFIATTDSNSFIMEMELNFDNEESTPTQALQQQLGSGATFNREDWYADAGLDMILGNGSWDSENNRPILVMRETDTHQDASNNTVTEERIEVVTKIEADETVNGLLSFGNCIDQEKTCDIQVDQVVAADNIRWGAWLTEPGKGIQLAEFRVGNNEVEFQQEEDVLAFWIAAERADINQLIGEASFSANSDCANFNQCIGFADDGIIQSLTAQFDVNFTTGAIQNGNLTLETTEDPDLGIFGGTGDVMSTWNVNFSGQMASDGDTKLPEFQTQSLNGSVTESTGSSTAIIGNIGGIFVKPGDKFAGGYNLGTADGTKKHAAGVFSMDKK